MHLQIGRFLIVAGIVLLLLGLVVTAAGKFSFWGLGRLPGDISYKGRNVQFYFPIVTCLILSGLVTLMMWLISFISRK